MGDNTSADNQVVGKVPPVEANHTEDVFYYLSVGKGKVFRVQVSIEVCCEVGVEDERCDMLINFQEALSKTMVGMHQLTQKTHISEYHGTVWVEPQSPMEDA